MNYAVEVIDNSTDTNKRVIVPTLQTASGILTHFMSRGYVVKSYMTPDEKYTHRNSASAQSDIELTFSGLFNVKEGRILHAVK